MSKRFWVWICVWTFLGEVYIFWFGYEDSLFAVCSHCPVIGRQVLQGIHLPRGVRLYTPRPCLLNDMKLHYLHFIACVLAAQVLVVCIYVWIFPPIRFQLLRVAISTWSARGPSESEWRCMTQRHHNNGGFLRNKTDFRFTKLGLLTGSQWHFFRRRMSKWGNQLNGFVGKRKIVPHPVIRGAMK